MNGPTDNKLDLLSFSNIALSWSAGAQLLFGRLPVLRRFQIDDANMSYRIVNVNVELT